MKCLFFVVIFVVLVGGVVAQGTVCFPKTFSSQVYNSMNTKTGIYSFSLASPPLPSCHLTSILPLITHRLFPRFISCSLSSFSASGDEFVEYTGNYYWDTTQSAICVELYEIDGGSQITFLIRFDLVFQIVLTCWHYIMLFACNLF
jgi:hypothetical protein